jgi:hypothetical protein
MNREFSVSSRQARSILAIAAVLATALIVGSIEGLSRHYNAEAQLASAKPVSVAQR